jgi:hypothetical protein
MTLTTAFVLAVLSGALWGVHRRGAGSEVGKADFDYNRISLAAMVSQVR